jgi:MYXO-CTERM domain-containing protein
MTAPAPALAHGIFGHVHVTGWAIENLPDGELRDFFADPEVFNAALFGAAFTDSGYWQTHPDKVEAARAYSEHTHWEPFIEDFVEWVATNDPPPWDDYESRMRVAFLMGCASHGMQDEIFDSLFLHHVEHQDAGSQDNADPGTDGFLALDGYIHFSPDQYIPMETLLELYAVLPENVTEQTVLDAVKIMTSTYVNDGLGPAIAASLGEEYEADLPWTRIHYLDPEVPGSLRAEVFPTARYLEALWKRLHGELSPEDTVIYTFPDPPRRLYGVEAASPDPWVTLIYGIGVSKSSVAATWKAEGEAPEEPGPDVPFLLKGTRWGSYWTRLHRLQPQVSPTPAQWYEVIWGPGAERIDGPVTSEPYAFTFQAPCDSPDDALCPDLGELPLAAIDPPDAGSTAPDADAGAGEDTGAEDASPDAAADAAIDAQADTGDAGGTDAGSDAATDTGAPPADAAPASDSGQPDAAAVDKGGGAPEVTADVTADAAPDVAPDAKTSIGHDDGCRTTRAPAAGGAALVLLLGLLASGRRRRTNTATA